MTVMEIAMIIKCDDARLDNADDRDFIFGLMYNESGVILTFKEATRLTNVYQEEVME